jgi:hypothetical protein
LTTLWFQTVKAVALSSVAAPAATSRVHRSGNHAESTRSTTRNQTAAENALLAASMLTRTATVLTGTSEATRPSSTKSGLPGGCGMPSVYAAVMYSLASHSAVVGARVRP